MELVLLKVLYEQGKAEQIKVLLDSNGISSKINYARNNLEMTIGQQTSKEIEIFVFENEIDKAHEIIQPLFDDVGGDLDISNYSVDELKDILLNKDDWHESFVIEAEKILKEKGIHVSEEKVRENLDKKIEEVRAGVTVKPLNIVLLWFLCVFGFLLGLAAGYFLWQAKTRASDGKRYYLYNASARDQGKWMLIIGVILIVIEIYALQSI